MIITLTENKISLNTNILLNTSKRKRFRLLLIKYYLGDN